MEANQNPQDTLNEITARRRFLGKIGKAAVTAPAVALLLTASAKPAAASYSPQGGGPRTVRRTIRRGR